MDWVWITNIPQWMCCAFIHITCKSHLTNTTGLGTPALWDQVISCSSPFAQSIVQQLACMTCYCVTYNPFTSQVKNGPCQHHKQLSSVVFLFWANYSLTLYFSDFHHLHDAILVFEQLVMWGIHTPPQPCVTQVHRHTAAMLGIYGLWSHLLFSE